MFNLPSTVLVNRQMPKKAFYEHLKTTAVVRDQFVNNIERIELIAALKNETIHIPAGNSIVEIDILGLYLKEDAVIPKETIACIASSISNKLLFACISQERVQFGVMRGELFWTEPVSLNSSVLSITGSTLDELWDSISSQVVFGVADPEDFSGRLTRKKELLSSQKELAKLQKRLAGEKQIAKRNELFDQIKKLTSQIHELEASR